MKNLFILGSPRKGGNSETMARTIAKGILKSPANSVEHIYLNDLNIKPCQACGACSKTGECVINDDMQELYSKTNTADRIFFVSPVYFYSVSAQLKCYIDRCQAQWARKYLLNTRNSKKTQRTGYLISCAGTEGKKLFDGSILIIKCLCDTLDIQYGSPLFLRNIEPLGALQNKTDELVACLNFGVEIGTNLPAT